MMTEMRFKENKFLALWLAVGFFFLLSGLYIFPSRSGYKTVFYLTFLMPSMLVVVFDFKNTVKPFFRGSSLYFIAFMIYLAFSTVWGRPDEALSNFKRVMYIVVAACGIFWLYSQNKKYFIYACLASVAMVSIISVFWMTDFYLLSDRPLSARFLSGRFDYFELYEKGQYGGFYNPLLLSHTVTFMLLLTMALFLTWAHRLKTFSVLLAVCFSVLFLLLICTQTRMAWVSFLAVISMLVLIHSSKKINLLFFLGLVIGCVLFLQIDHRVVNRGFSLRPEIWASTLESMPGFWVFGKGLDAHMAISVPGIKKVWSDTHNIYLEVLYYSGFVGLFMLAAFMFKVAQELGWNLKASLWCSIWCVYVALSGMADGGGLIARPNEHWFKIYLPVIMILIYCREMNLKSGYKLSGSH